MGLQPDKIDRTVCFSIANLAQLNAADANLIPALEVKLARNGAIPVKIDAVEQICCIRLSQTVQLQEIKELLKSAGCDGVAIQGTHS